MKNPFILGVTGVIGSGKSALCRFLQEKRGFVWIDADTIVRELYKKDAPGYQKIKEYFGASFVGAEEVNRGRLRRFVLKSHQKLRILNQLIHPLAVHEVNKKIVHLESLYKKQNKPLCVCIEAVYFGPKDLGKFIDRLVVVDASDAVILKRLAARKIPPAQLKSFLLIQRKNMLAYKTAFVVQNNAVLKNMFKKANSFLLQARL